MKDKDIIYKDKNAKKRFRRSLVVVFTDESEITNDTVKSMLSINNNEALRIVKVRLNDEETNKKITSYTKDLGIGKENGDRVYIFSERGLVPYDCEKNV